MIVQIIAAVSSHYTPTCKAPDPMESITVTTLTAPNPPPLALARPHPYSPRLGSYCELAASPHLAVGLRPGGLGASHNHYQGQRGLELDRIEGRLARRGARLASGGFLVGAVVSFLLEVCRVRFCFVRRGVVRACVVVVAARAGSSGRVASVVVGVLVPAGLLAASVGAPAVVRSRCVAWRVLVGRAGLALLARCGPRVGFLRRAAPFFSADSTLGQHNTSDRCGETLPAGAGCAGSRSSIRCGGTNREEYLKRQRRQAKRVYAIDQGLNQTSG